MRDTFTFDTYMEIGLVEISEMIGVKYRTLYDRVKANKMGYSFSRRGKLYISPHFSNRYLNLLKNILENNKQDIVKLKYKIEEGKYCKNGFSISFNLFYEFMEKLIRLPSLQNKGAVIKINFSVDADKELFYLRLFNIQENDKNLTTENYSDYFNKQLDIEFTNLIKEYQYVDEIRRNRFNDYFLFNSQQQKAELR